MKKILLCFIWLLFILLLCGCKYSQKMNNDYFEKKQDFDMVATCRQNDVEYIANIKREGNHMQFKYISPENIKDLCFIFNFEKEKISYMGLDIIEEKGQLLKAVLPEVILTAIEDSLAKSGEDNDGITEYGIYNVTVDRGTGLLKKLTLPNYNFQCFFEAT